MRKLLGAMDKSLAGVEISMIVLLVSLMVLMAFFQVFMRNAFESGILWGDIFLRHLVLWVGFIGASLATRDNKHISIDALSRILSPKALALTKYLTDTVTIVVCAVLAHAGWKFVMYEKESGSTLFKKPRPGCFRSSSRSVLP